MKMEKNLWIWIAAVAAAVAAVTTVAVLLLRARQKAAEIKEPVYECDCCDCSDEASDEVAPETEEDVTE